MSEPELKLKEPPKAMSQEEFMAHLANCLGAIAQATTALCEIFTAEIEEEVEKDGKTSFVKKRLPLGEIILTIQEDIAKIKEIQKVDLEKSHDLAPDDVPGYGDE